VVLRDAPVRISAEEGSGVSLDYDAAGRLIALEILDASTRVDGVDTVQLQVIPKPGAKQPAAAEWLAPRPRASSAPHPAHVLVDIAELQEVSLHSELKRAVAVNRDRDAGALAGLAVDVMAALGLQQLSAVALEQPAECLARERLHPDASHAELDPCRGSAGSASSGGAVSSQAWIASRTFASSSSMVSPWLTQPGRAGTSAQKPPSSASCTTILTFIRAPHRRTSHSCIV
jgi:YD repeat-containing protein